MVFILIGLALAVPVFAAQLLLCFFAKKTAVKLIPIYCSVVCAILLFLMYFGGFGTWSAGILGNGQELAAGILGIIVGVSMVGIILGWGIWIIYYFVKRAKN